MKKKTYEQPETMVATIETLQMIAFSGEGTDDMKSSDIPDISDYDNRSRLSVWDNGEE